MFGNVFRFELRYRLRSWSTWVCFAILTLLVYRDTLSGNWDDLIASGRVARNSPYAMYFLFMYYTFWTATLGGGLVIQSILRDFQSRSADIIYSYPVDSRGYFWGKYLAALAILVLVSAAVVAGFVTLPWMASALGIKPASDFMPVSWLHIASGFALLTLPNCFFFGTVFFALAALTARPGPAYTAIVVFVGLFMAIGVTFGEGTTFKLMQIIDPFGKQTLEAQLLYWTAQERMNGFLQLQGSMLWNRALYAAVAVLVLAICVQRFDLRAVLMKRTARAASSRPEGTRAGAVKEVGKADRAEGGRTLGERLLRAATTSSGWYYLRFALDAGWHELRLTSREGSFRIAYAAVFLMTVSAAWGFASFHTVSDGNLLPTAAELLHRASIVPTLLCMVGTSYYAVEIVLRERSARIAALVDACPVPTWALMLSKVTGAVLLATLFALIPGVSTLLIQTGQGFFEFDVPLLLQATFLWAVPLTIGYALVAVVCAGLVPVRGAAQALAIVIGITSFTLQETKVLEHHLTLWGVPFAVELSGLDVNTELLRRAGAFALYWLSLYAVLCCLTYWAWARGERTARQRVVSMSVRSHPISATIAAAALAVCVTTGMHIHQVVNKDNGYRSYLQRKADRAQYERTLGGIRAQVQPVITSATLVADIYPRERRAVVSAALDLENVANTAVSELHLEMPEEAVIDAASLNETALVQEAVSGAPGHYIMTLPGALQPAGRATFHLQGELHYTGFANEGRRGTLAAGSSYLPTDLWPRLGYQREQELCTAGDRRLADLPPRALLPPAGDAQQRSWVSDDAGHLVVTTTLTTDADHIALAPGELLSHRVASGRNVFSYRSSAAQLWNPQVISGRWQVRRQALDVDGGDVNVEVYFHPAHAYNVQRFVDAARSAIDQGSALWGPYPHRTLRIAETPREIANVASSGNLIVIAENRGWTHDYRGPVPFDWIGYVLAREISRAWWGDGVTPAATRGAVLIAEGLPALHGLMALERSSGLPAVQRYVDVLAERYLRATAREDQREPAVLDLDDQPYAADRAALAAHQIYRVLGHKRFAAALADFYRDTRARGQPPFADTADLARRFVAAASLPAERELIEEALHRTTVYDYRIRSATSYSLPKDRYLIDVRLEGTAYGVKQGAAGADADGTNRRASPAIGEIIIAVYERNQATASVALSVPLSNGAATALRELGFRPDRVEIDPQRLRIDRNLSDNQRPFRAERVLPPESAP